MKLTTKQLIELRESTRYLAFNDAIIHAFNMGYQRAVNDQKPRYDAAGNNSYLKGYN